MNEDCQISMKDLSTSAENSLIVFSPHDLLRNTSYNVSVASVIQSRAIGQVCKPNGQVCKPNSDRSSIVIRFRSEPSQVV